MNIPFGVDSLYNRECNISGAQGPQNINGALHFWCDRQFTQGKVYVGLDLEAQCPIIDSATPTQTIKTFVPNSLSDMTLWVAPGLQPIIKKGPQITPTPPSVVWYEEIWGYAVTLNDYAGTINNIFAVIKIAARINNRLNG